jgi:hypothetical protein
VIQAFDEAENILHPVDHLWPTGVIPDAELTQMLVVGQPHWPGSAYLDPEADPTTGVVPEHPLLGTPMLRIPCMYVVPRGTPDSIPFEARDIENPEDKDKAWASMMPGRFPIKSLLERRRRMTRHRWMLQMMIDWHLGDSDVSVIEVNKVEQFHVDPEHLKVLSMCIDPADSEDGCEWGLAAAGIFKNRIHVIDMDGFHARILDEIHGLRSGEEVFDQLFEYADMMRVSRIYIEKNYRNAIVAAKRVVNRKQMNAQVYEYSANANKLKRILGSLEHPFGTGLVTMEPHVLRRKANIEQLRRIKYTRLPEPNDRIDALAGLVHVLMEHPALRVEHVPQVMKAHIAPSEARIMSFRSIAAENPFVRLGA